MNEPTNDQQTTVLQLREMVRVFVEERDWRQFHSPKNVSMGIAIEAAELMEHFQWLTEAASRNLPNDPEQLAAAGDELADVLCYCIALANELELDISEIMVRKMAKNRQKYPAELSRGKYFPPELPPTESSS